MVHTLIPMYQSQLDVNSQLYNAALAVSSNFLQAYLLCIVESKNEKNKQTRHVGAH